jgi:hypothetical protein
MSLTPIEQIGVSLFLLNDEFHSHQNGLKTISHSTIAGIT